MNLEREFLWQKKVYEFLVHVQLFVERFLPKKRGSILSIDELDNMCSNTFMESFQKNMDEIAKDL